MSQRRLLLGTIVCAIGAVAIGIALSSCGCGGGGKADAGAVMRVRTGPGPEGMRKPTAEERAQLRMQIEVVKNYWAFPYLSEYDLFSSSFKQILKSAHGVSNGAEYERVMSSNQRNWLKETYQKAEQMDPTQGRVTVLVDWEEAGYNGVQTVIFDTINEGGEWKISSIFY